MEMLSKVFNVDSPFTDRFQTDPAQAVDVIIPIIHTTDLWEANLRSIYKEVPVNRLLISDGGCIDNSVDVAKKFPRVEIFDHRNYKSLGFCIRKLIEEVQTERFAYFHSDVYLTEGWFEEMKRHANEFDWYESRQINTFLLEIPFDYRGYDRPLSGGQIGRKAAFSDLLKTIDDDYLYRNEDIIFAELIRKSGGKYGRAENAYLHHQIMNKTSAWKRKISGFSIQVEKSPEEELREWSTQVRGLIKYLPPGGYPTDAVLSALGKLMELKAVDREELNQWVATTPYGSEWLDVINGKLGYRRRIYLRLRTFAALVYGFARQSWIETKLLGRAVLKGC